MTEQLIELSLIIDNKFQPRTTDDPEHIEKLARSIAADGLLQEPKAQKIFNGCHELAYGHSRRKAFEWLNANWQEQGLPDRYNGYSVMPLDVVEEISDEDLYRYAITENIQRKDLSPIEEAQAMVRYRDEFKKSSDEVGELFGKNGATVRGLIRLLDLPEAVKEKVASGELTQGAARKVLTVSRVDKSQLTTIVKDILDGEDPDDVIEDSLRDSDKSIQMWPSWKHDEKPRGGPSLWLLHTKPENFPTKHLPALRATNAAKALGIEFTAQNRPQLERWLEGLSSGTVRGVDGIREYPDGPIADHFIAEGAPADQIEKLAHLIAPPACVDCPFHALVDRSHYCVFKACHQRKTKAFIASEMEKLSKKLGIAIYDPAVDGKATLPLSEYSYMDEYKRHQKLVESKDANLRLASHKSEYSAHSFTDSHHIRVVLVGEGAKAIKETRQEAADKERQKQQARELQWKLERERRAASDKFLEQYAQALFAAAFKELTNLPAMCALVGANPPKKDAKKNGALNEIRKRMADRALSNSVGWQQLEKGPIATAKHLQGVATTWGVKLPADFLEAAKGFEPVSAETPKKAKKS
jgi:ParB-like chromosome segregation protein Spo0J